MPFHVDFVINENFLGILHLLVEEDSFCLEKFNILPNTGDSVRVATLLS